MANKFRSNHRNLISIVLYAIVAMLLCRSLARLLRLLPRLLAARALPAAVAAPARMSTSTFVPRPSNDASHDRIINSASVPVRDQFKLFHFNPLGFKSNLHLVSALVR